MTTTDPPADIVLADTATRLGAAAKGAVIVTGSHGGRYAGVGKDEAGIAVSAMAEELGVAAATASHASCRIGDAADMMARGAISYANALAISLGVTPGMTCRDAAQRLSAARPSKRDPAAADETRCVLAQPGWHRRIVLIDSASLVSPEDAGQIIVTASHGALVGGDAAMALRVDAFAAVFSDAGVGMDGAGVTRLPALDVRGIAGLAVSAASARIGDAASLYDDGIVSHANDTARRLGARAGEPLKRRLIAWAAD
jgi:hypothetical protein